MAELACRTSDSIMVDPWEAVQPGYTTTARVLDHFDSEINDALGGGIDVEVDDEEDEGAGSSSGSSGGGARASSNSAVSDGNVDQKKKRRKKKRVRVVLLAGADLIETMVRTGQTLL